MSTLIDSRLVGKTIKHLRLSKNWTQDYLADTIGYSVRNLRRIENDGTTTFDVVNTFAELFGVSALDILAGDVFCTRALRFGSVVALNIKLLLLMLKWCCILLRFKETL